MYEEVDERYQEKRIRMLQAQNMQIEEQFHRHLLAAFTARANSNAGSAASSIASRRSSMAPRASIDGAASSRKMSIDLSNLRSPFPQSRETTSMSSPMTTAAGDGYMLSPATTYDSNAPSYITGMDGSESYSGMMGSATTAASSAQIPAYVGEPPIPTWPASMTPSPAWTAMQQHVPTPNQTPTDSQAVQMWQQHMMQQAQMSNDATAAVQMRQFRERLASAPELPVQQAATPAAPAASLSGHGHSRGQSQPSNNIHNLHLLTQGTHLSQMVPSSSNSPKIESLSAETQSTPDFCPTPNTPLSPTAVGTTRAAPPVKDEGDGVMVSHEELDPDFNEFSQFALGLGNSSLQERDFSGFDEFVALDDYASVSC